MIAMLGGWAFTIVMVAPYLMVGYQIWGGGISADCRSGTCGTRCTAVLLVKEGWRKEVRRTWTVRSLEHD